MLVTITVPVPQIRKRTLIYNEIKKPAGYRFWVGCGELGGLLGYLQQ